MARRVFFHIGAPKTGTTYLQDVLWNNRARLKEQGILIPGNVRMDWFHATLAVREKPGRDRRPEHIATAWDRIVDEARQWDSTAIISHEFFAEATAEQAKKAILALAPAEVHVVFTARDYVRQLPAVWQEAIKMRADMTFSQFVEDALADRLTGPWSWRTIDTAAVLERWGAELPPEHVHVVTVPSRGADRDLLWKRFAGLCGIDPSWCELDAAKPNESLGVVEARLLQYLQPKLSRLGTLQERYRWLRAFFAHQILGARQGERFGLRPEEAKAVRARALDAVARIRSRGYDVVGDLEELVAPEPLPDLPHPDDVSEAELLDAATDVIADLIVQVRRRTLQSENRARQLKHVEQRSMLRATDGSTRARRLGAGARRITVRIRDRMARRRPGGH